MVYTVSRNRMSPGIICLIGIALYVWLKENRNWENGLRECISISLFCIEPADQLNFFLQRPKHSQSCLKALFCPTRGKATEICGLPRKLGIGDSSFGIFTIDLKALLADQVPVHVHSRTFIAGIAFLLAWPDFSQFFGFKIHLLTLLNYVKLVDWQIFGP